LSLIVADGDSFDALPKWYDAFYKANHKRGQEEVPVIVIGTKVDDIKVCIQPPGPKPSRAIQSLPCAPSLPLSPSL
jgi:hypothetical protein